jgi:hypothetical protein
MPVMKSTLWVSGLCLAVGFAGGWLLRPLASHRGPAAGTPAANENSPSGVARPAGGPSVAGKATKVAERPRTESAAAEPKAVMFMNGKRVEGEEMEEMQQRMHAQMRQRLLDSQRKKLDARLAKLAAELGLDPQQQAQLKQEIERRLAKLDESSPLGPLMGDPKRMRELAGWFRQDALDEAAAPLLTDAQTGQHAALRERERQGRVESRALKDLSKLTTVIELSAEQRDSVYQVLAAEAARREDQPRPVGAMTLFTEDAGIEFNDELGMSELMQEQMEAIHASGDPAMPPDDADWSTKMRATLQQRIDQRVELLRPALGEEQLQQYRAHLEQKAAGMSRMMIGGVNVKIDAEEP